MQEKLPDIKSKDLVRFLQENGFEAKSAQSTIEDDAIGFLLKNFSQLAAQKKESRPVKQDKPAKPDKQGSGKKNKQAKNTHAAKQPETGTSKQPAGSQQNDNVAQETKEVKEEIKPETETKHQTTAMMVKKRQTKKKLRKM